MQAHEPCGMMIVGLGLEQAEQYLNEMRTNFPELKIFTACLNSSSNTIVSGLGKHLDAFKEILEARLVFSQRLKVRLAYHSQYMIAIAKDYEMAIGSVYPYLCN